MLEMRSAKCGEVVEKERTAFCRGFANCEREHDGIALGGTCKVAHTSGRGSAHDATVESGGSRIFCDTEGGNA
jgi:hypothetical protein